MIRFATKKTRPGWVQITIDMPDTGYDDVVYEGSAASERLFRFCHGLIDGADAGTGCVSVQVPPGWKRAGVDASGIHKFSKGALGITVSIGKGLFILGVSCYGRRATDEQCELARKAFVPPGIEAVERRAFSSHVRYFFGAIPGYRLVDPSDAHDIPLAVPLQEHG